MASEATNMYITARICTRDIMDGGKGGFWEDMQRSHAKNWRRKNKTKKK